MGIIPVSFRADHELEVLQAFSGILPLFNDPLVKATTQRFRSFEDGALEYVGTGGIYAVFCQWMVDGEDAVASTIALVDAIDLDAMARGENVQPDISLTSFIGTGYPGIHAILSVLPEAIERRLAEHDVDPLLNANFDWCRAIERRAQARAAQEAHSATARNAA